MSPSNRRGPWIPEEDARLLQLVRSQGPNNWVRISQLMHFRSPKQCRERFHQNLKPSLNHEPISPEEGLMIERMVHEMGKRWAEIARRLGNRSDNAVKNWWNGSMNRRRRVNCPAEVRISSAAQPRSYHHPEQSWHAEPHAMTLLTHGPVSQMHHQPAHHYTHTPAFESRRRPEPLYTLRSPRQPLDAAMVSPVYSEYSATPPSMVSDHNSVSSVSPKTSYSPRSAHFGYDVQARFTDPRFEVRRESEPHVLPPLRLEEHHYPQVKAEPAPEHKSPALSLPPGSILPVPQMSATRQSPMRLTSLLN